jgi:FdhD protein
MNDKKEFFISPDLENDKLTEKIDCINEIGEHIQLPVVKEVPLTIYLNKQEIVTAMTLGDMPDLLAVGYLLNQNMLKKDDVISEINYDKDLCNSVPKPTPAIGKAKPFSILGRFVTRLL